jgi:hypothetical protein
MPRDPLMTMMHRRRFLGATTLFLEALGLFVPVNVASAQQISAKPEVKISEAKPVIVKYVEQMSQAAKKDLGVELSAEQQIEMVDASLSNMKPQGSYAFVDP